MSGVTFTRTEPSTWHGGFTVDHPWPKEIEVTEELILTADPKFLRESGWRILSFGVENGWAVYRRTLFDRLSKDSRILGIRRYRLRACEYEPAEGGNL